jgi:alpha-L-rhamnosidase
MKGFNVFKSIWVAAFLLTIPLFADVVPAKLRCGYRTNPMGVDDVNPRLSWQLVATASDQRDQSGTAYQIQVASCDSLLASNKPDLWDSGKVASTHPFSVSYCGKHLTSVEQLFWRVRVWDQDDKTLDWSHTATWTMGLLYSNDWKGGWIGAPTHRYGFNSKTRQAPLPIFRRQFMVRAGLRRALIVICGLGQYELSVNGAKVGSALLTPGWTKYDKSCLYDALDLTSSLTNGENVVGVMLGNGMYNVQATSRYTKFTGSFGQPKVIAQMYFFYNNGTIQVIPTDSQWLTTYGPITYSHVYGGENYDARLLPVGWNEAGSHTCHWSRAVITSGPGGQLRGQSYAAPPIVAIQTLQPVQTNSISRGTFVYDLGQNAAIIPNLTTHGQRGSIVRIIPAELTNTDGTVNRSSVGNRIAYWQYTLAGKGPETWFPRFFYHGCRYLQVTLTSASGSSQLPVVDALSGVVIQSSSASTGDFTCSNDLFNRTRAIIRWAQRNNMVSVLTDCPHRERLGWLEQFSLHEPSLHYEFDVGQLFSKTMQDMADSQRSSGLVPDIAPEYVVFSGGFRDSPEWGSSVIIVPWQEYLFTGDDTLLRNYYSAMTNYFCYLSNRATNNCLNYPHGLGDWYDIGTNAPGYSQLTPISLTADAYYCLDAQVLAKAAKAIGKVDDAMFFDSLATNIGMSFNAKYYSETKHCYASGSQTAQALPLVLGVVDPTNKAAVTSALIESINACGLTAGDIGHRYVLRALADTGHSDIVFNLHSSTNQPGYGYILAKGSTALTEAWNANPSSSQDHFMLGHITEWFYHDLAGIQLDPDVPGFEHVIIKPAFVGNISWVKADYNSVLGMIVSNWSFTNNLATLEVNIPVGATGSVCLPILGNAITNISVKESNTTIWQNDATATRVKGVIFDKLERNGSQTYLRWTVGSGRYYFAWNLQVNKSV